MGDSSTISSMIARFRSNKPMPREDRVKPTADFWWLKESATSTSPVVTPIIVDEAKGPLDLHTKSKIAKSPARIDLDDVISSDSSVEFSAPIPSSTTGYKSPIRQGAAPLQMFRYSSVSRHKEERPHLTVAQLLAEDRKRRDIKPDEDDEFDKMLSKSLRRYGRGSTDDWARGSVVKKPDPPAASTAGSAVDSTEIPPPIVTVTGVTEGLDAALTTLRKQYAVAESEAEKAAELARKKELDAALKAFRNEPEWVEAERVRKEKEAAKKKEEESKESSDFWLSKRFGIEGSTNPSLFPTAAETTDRLERDVKSLTEALEDRMKAIDAIEHPAPAKPKEEAPKTKERKPLVLLSDSDSGDDSEVGIRDTTRKMMGVEVGAAEEKVSLPTAIKGDDFHFSEMRAARSRYIVQFLHDDASGKAPTSAAAIKKKEAEEAAAKAKAAEEKKKSDEALEAAKAVDLFGMKPLAVGLSAEIVDAKLLITEDLDNAIGLLSSRLGGLSVEEEKAHSKKEVKSIPESSSRLRHLRKRDESILSPSEIDRLLDEPGFPKLHSSLPPKPPVSSSAVAGAGEVRGKRALPLAARTPVVFFEDGYYSESDIRPMAEDWLWDGDSALPPRSSKSKKIDVKSESSGPKAAEESKSGTAFASPPTSPAAEAKTRRTIAVPMPKMLLAPTVYDDDPSIIGDLDALARRVMQTRAMVADDLGIAAVADSGEFKTLDAFGSPLPPWMYATAHARPLSPPAPSKNVVTASSSMPSSPARSHAVTSHVSATSPIGHHDRLHSDVSSPLKQTKFTYPHPPAVVDVKTPSELAVTPPVHLPMPHGYGYTAISTPMPAPATHSTFPNSRGLTPSRGMPFHEAPVASKNRLTALTGHATPHIATPAAAEVMESLHGYRRRREMIAARLFQA